MRKRCSLLVASLTAESTPALLVRLITVYITREMISRFGISINRFALRMKYMYMVAVASMQELAIA